MVSFILPFCSYMNMLFKCIVVTFGLFKGFPSSRNILFPEVISLRAWLAGRLEIGLRNWALEIGPWKSGIGNWALEIGLWKLDLGNLALEIWPWKMFPWNMGYIANLYPCYLHPLVVHHLEIPHPWKKDDLQCWCLAENPLEKGSMEFLPLEKSVNRPNNMVLEVVNVAG